MHLRQDFAVCDMEQPSTYSGVTESHNVDWHVSGMPLPTSQQLICYGVIIALFIMITDHCDL